MSKRNSYRRASKSKGVSALTLPIAHPITSPVFDDAIPIYGNKILGYKLVNDDLCAIRNVIGYKEK